MKSTKEAARLISESFGKYSDKMKLSVGAGFFEDSSEHNIMEIAIVVDQRMYEDKVEYYRVRGIDRRGQAAAHKALCALYTKILKINLTDDTFSIINMDVLEQTEEKGYANNISVWLKLNIISLESHQFLA